MEMSDAPRRGIAYHDARAIDGSNEGSLALLFRNQQLRLALRFFISILECLSHIDCGFQREVVSISRDIRRTDVLKTACRSLLHEFNNVPGPIDIHPKDFFTIFLLKRQRSRTMPNLVCRCQDLSFSGFAQT